jgi:hypothetical protein
MNFKGAGVRIDDLDIPRIGREIGVGEDEVHALMEVEARGSGFDSLGRLTMLFEPHKMYQNTIGPIRQRAVSAGVAYPNWGTRPYPKDSYPVLLKAMAIDETAALESASWGLGQILGSNYEAAGYRNVHAMVESFCADEANQLQAMINFLIANKLDDDLRRHDWTGVARGYNGSGQVKYYAGKLEAAFKKWQKIKDTPYPPKPAPPVKPASAPVIKSQPPVTTYPWPWFKFW